MKDLEYLYQLFDVSPKQKTCEIKARLLYKFTFNNNFMMNREPNLQICRNSSKYVFFLIVKKYANLVTSYKCLFVYLCLNSVEYKVYKDFTDFYKLDNIKNTAMFHIITAQFVIFKPLSYCFEEITGFDVKASFANRSVSRLIR